MQSTDLVSRRKMLCFKKKNRDWVENKAKQWSRMCCSASAKVRYVNKYVSNQEELFPEPYDGGKAQRVVALNGTRVTRSSWLHSLTCPEPGRFCPAGVERVEWNFYVFEISKEKKLKDKCRDQVARIFQDGV